jgi:DNA-binding protein Fis
MNRNTSYKNNVKTNTIKTNNTSTNVNKKPISQSVKNKLSEMLNKLPSRESIDTVSILKIIGTIILAIITTYVYKISLWKSILLWFIAGEILHYYFGVQTAVLTTLGIDACSAF